MWAMFEIRGLQNVTTHIVVHTINDIYIYIYFIHNVINSSSPLSDSVPQLHYQAWRLFQTLPLRSKPSDRQSPFGFSPCIECMQPHPSISGTHYLPLCTPLPQNDHLCSTPTLHYHYNTKKSKDIISFKFLRTTSIHQHGARAYLEARLTKKENNVQLCFFLSSHPSIFLSLCKI